MNRIASRTSGASAASATLFLSRGGVSVIKAVGDADPASAVTAAAERLDSAEATRWSSPVRLVVRVAGHKAPAFDATWAAPSDVGTLELVRRGYLHRNAIRLDGKLTAPVRVLVERIADLVLGLEAS
jgi:hypothetical protein